MRIVAGQWRGRRLKTPGKTKGIRPTSDRLREALFNILAARFEGGVFIDLYAGTGAVGLEAASRGAVSVYLIEKSRSAQKVCQANIELLDAQSQVSLKAASASSPGALPLARVAFADPPYAHDPQIALDALLAVSVEPDGCWCLEIAVDAPVPAPSEGVAAVLDRVYGGSRLIIYERVQS